ncbi:cholecystokinin receptor type A-like [Pecten maximus]|uniref:cholecystokinin receptor type A-like n=1 Tax=Pecten maximus TaxID=6579 RepID=UPI00145800B3|nr:cholecystokinin receptor type A-like [Pecten maximus]
MSRIDLTTNNSELTLQEIEWQIFVEKDIPLTVFLSILSVIGTLENFMVILTVGRRGRWPNYRILIQCLAVADLFSCALSIPGYVVLSRFRYTIESDVFCRCTTMFHIFVGAYSVDLLCFISIERFRKTCRPFAKQFSITHTKIVSACLAVFDLGLATLGLFTFSAQPIMVGKLTGHCCRIIKEGTFAKIFSQTLSLFLFLKIVVCTILYIIIGRTILMHRKHIPMIASFKHQSSRNMNPHGDQENNKDRELNGANGCNTQRISTKSVTSYELSTLSQSNGSNRQQRSTLKGKALYTKSAQISFMFLMCTCLSFLSFVPVLAIRCIGSFDWQLRVDLFEFLGPMAGIVYRLHVLNHVINPIVYCLTNSNFRRDCTNLFKCRA